MSRSKKAVYKTLLTKDIMYIINKGVYIQDIKQGNYKLKAFDKSNWWNSIWWLT